jgi:L-alanine-DL-glutamate epimerase-like enolase superfamily enzyme
LLPGTGFDNDDLEALNRRLADDAAETVPVYKITVTCETEQQQAELQARLTKEGFRAVRGS